MSLIIPRNFKREKAQDAAAQDIKLPFIITFNNGKKEFREGYSEEDVRRRFDKSVAALYGGIKSVKLEDEDRRNGKDSIAADAEFKVGDKVKLSGSHPRFPNKVGVVTHVFSTGFVKVKVDGIEDIEIAERLISKTGDAAEFHVGQKVKHTRFGTIGKVFEIAPDGAIGVQWSNGQAYYGKFHMPISEIVAVDE